MCSKLLLNEICDQYCLPGWSGFWPVECKHGRPDFPLARSTDRECPTFFSKSPTPSRLTSQPHRTPNGCPVASRNSPKVGDNSTLAATNADRGIPGGNNNKRQPKRPLTVASGARGLGFHPAGLATLSRRVRTENVNVGERSRIGQRIDDLSSIRSEIRFDWFYVCPRLGTSKLQEF